MSLERTDLDNGKQNLVLVHGYLGGSRQWENQVKAFSENYNVITPDLPGYGLNNKLQSPESIAEYAGYVLNELDELNVKSFNLLGHSMGGMIVQEMVAQIQQQQKDVTVKKLVLYGTGPVGIMPGRFETIEESKQRLMTEGLESNARRISSKWFVKGKEGIGYQECSDIAVQASPQAAQAGLTAMQDWLGSNTNLLSKITMPTLVLWGDRDQSYQWPLPEQLWREIPNSSLSVVAGCSHAVHLEKPKLFNAVLKDFLTMN